MNSGQLDRMKLRADIYLTDFTFTRVWVICRLTLVVVTVVEAH